MSLTTFLKHSARRIPAVKRLYSEIQRLRTENASEVATIRALTAERNELRGRLAQLRMENRAGMSPAVLGGPKPAPTGQEMARFFSVPLIAALRMVLLRLWKQPHAD